MSTPFRSYSGYLREKYGRRVQRVAVDAGFSCPNRSGGAPGCAYCDEQGARAPYLPGGQEAGQVLPGGNSGGNLEARKLALRRQIEARLRFLEARYGPGPCILYFQAFTNTFAPPATLRQLYDYALGLGPFRELVVATRPDCVATETAALLGSYRRADRDVWVELGLQSAHDRTLARIDRGHTLAHFQGAYALLREQGVKLAVHLIFGLPGEGLEEMLATVRLVAALEPDGVKIHNLHVPRGCRLARELACGELTVPSDRRHLSYTLRALELLPPQTVIMRLTCDTPRERLAAPRRFMSKERFYRELRALMRSRATWQGRLFPGG